MPPEGSPDGTILSGIMGRKMRFDKKDDAAENKRRQSLP